MRSRVNKIRNPDFSLGADSPRHWSWAGTGGGPRLRTPFAERPGDGGLVLTNGRHGSAAMWSQVVVCKPGEFYRVEAVVSCELQPAVAAGGAVLQVQPLAGNRPAGEAVTTPGLFRASQPTIIRAYYRAPLGVRCIRVGVGIAGGTGTAAFHTVRFISILEPEGVSHPMAFVPPSQSQPPPRVVKSVCICGESGNDRLLTRRLGRVFDPRRVSSVPRADLDLDRLRADALLLLDDDSPSPLRSLSRLLVAAEDRVVIVSLPAFAKLTGGRLSVRRVEQADDPIHAKVVHSNFATNGFALHDAFPYAWGGQSEGSFVQNHFRKTPALGRFCKRHGFEPLLVSVCNTDPASERPICLYRPTTRGALFVLDLAPVEEMGSTLDEPALAMHLLLSILGRTQVGLGQYAVPVRRESELRTMIRDLGWRLEGFTVHDDDVPADRVRRQLVTVGGEDKTYGLTLRAKPLILVRSGLVSGDAESVHGALGWFRQLLRPPPFACPYASRLCARFRLAWEPCAAGWEARDGWQPKRRPADAERELEFADQETGILIDVVSRPRGGVRVVFTREDEAYERAAQWLPRLLSGFGPHIAGPGFTGSTPSADDAGEPARFPIGNTLDVTVDGESFRRKTPSGVNLPGTSAVRIELPAFEADFAARSIFLTDLAATLLEHVVGIHFGLIAVNRRTTVAHVEGLNPVEPGGCLVIERDDPMLRRYTVEAG